MNNIVLYLKNEILNQIVSFNISCISYSFNKYFSRRFNHSVNSNILLFKNISVFFSTVLLLETVFFILKNLFFLNKEAGNNIRPQVFSVHPATTLRGRYVQESTQNQQGRYDQELTIRRGQFCGRSLVNTSERHC